MTLRHLSAPFLALLVAACTSPTIREPSSAHMMSEKAASPSGNIPLPVPHTLAAPKPRALPKAETYSVVVNNVKVHDLLFALARDAKLNVDIHPGINGYVTLNAIDQTLPQLLNRIAKQVDMRYEIDGPNLSVMPDTPFLRNYPVDYVNMSRDTAGSVTVNTQLIGVASSGSGTTTTGAGANNSTTKVENKAQHRFWETLIQNIKDILRETDKILPEGSSETVVEQAGTTSTTGTGAAAGAQGRNTAPSAPLANSPNPATLQAAGTTVVKRTTFREAASVIAHPETGIITVRATSRQHEKVQEFLDKVQLSAKRQVMIEATIVEVQLANNYQQGINFEQLARRVGFGVAMTASPVVSAAGGGIFTLTYKNDDFTGAIKLLDEFGTTKVLSSPKISVLNNQTAILKVVDNEVYFTIKADTSQNQTTTVTTYTTTLHQVPVGFVMNVTPQISDTETVLLNVRPSISRIIGTVADPNPALKASTINGLTSDIESKVPVIRMREMESVLRIQNGNIAVMGGLMEDKLENKDQSVPGVGQVPLFGELFTQRNDLARKTELVIFLRPTIVRDPSIAGDYAAMREFMPQKNFFTDVPDPQNPGDKVNPFRRDQ